VSDSDRPWPHQASEYRLLKQVGRGAFAQVYSAVVASAQPASSSGPGTLDVNPSGYCYPYCAIKIIELENVNSSMDDIRQEVLIMRSVQHTNTLDCYASFVHNQQLWLVTQIMARGSCLHALQCLQERAAAFHSRAAADANDAAAPAPAPSPDVPLPGFPEQSVAYVLHQTLQGLNYFHSQGHIHRDVKAGNILLGSLGGVRLADFGVSGWLVNSADRWPATTVRRRAGGGGEEERGSMMTYKNPWSPTIMRVAGSATSAMRKPQSEKRVRNDEA
jgi:serine/threonine-protein kinase OSR1/STK39